MKTINIRFFIMLVLVAILALLIVPGVVFAAPAISADATDLPGGAGTIAWPGPFPAGLSNNDFFIYHTSFPNVLGDGIDEYTRWDFNFLGDPNYASFVSPGTGPLTSALLTLTLKRGTGALWNDQVRIDTGIGSTLTPVIPVGTTTTVQIQLLEPVGPYTSAEIKAALANGTPGEIPMFYQDDALLYSASLDLTGTPPATGTNTGGIVVVGFLTLAIGLVVLSKVTISRVSV